VSKYPWSRLGDSLVLGAVSGAPSETASTEARGAGQPTAARSRRRALGAAPALAAEGWDTDSYGRGIDAPGRTELT
jgi:hypothetical protein